MTTLPVTANAGAPPRLAGIISIACLLLAIAIPTSALYLGFAQPDILIKGMNLPKPVSAADLTLFQRISVALLGTVAPLFQAYGLLCARRCFQSFTRREFFTLDVVKSLRGFAAGLFMAIIASILAGPLLSFVVTLNAVSGEHTITFNIGTDEAMKLLFVGIFWQIAGVMLNAVKLADENSQFI